ncbi:hypothetical protein [Noviluteimonas gilva]|uniref:Uncharacterized protein n=1 Tax=Noviluteimonas gilva TaxID=2682097 RepID=A0A7C9HXT1_9GAMM|nr:hypothetical protein [Lysobacter gilvus]MUV13534.1 hypothetical protein [Lysobacter gilvus]
MNTDKTHYRKAFDSPYLSSADITEPTTLTIKRVELAGDRTKKTKDKFNTAHFVEKELRPGEPLKPMILNATNSKTMKQLTGSAFIDDWNDVRVTVYVDPSVKFGKDTVEGLRISPRPPGRKQLIPANEKGWANAKAAFLRDGNLDAVLGRVELSPEHQAQLIAECAQQSEAA